ncbi:hypothetical protein D3C71_1758710 [compost metagenome]
MDLLGPDFPAQALHAFGNGAAGNHHDFTGGAVRIAAHQGSELLAPLRNRRFIQAPTLVGHEAGAHLHHNATRITQNTGSHDLDCS